MANQHPADSWSPTNRFLFQCEICKINFPDVKDIRKHMSKVHPDLRTTFCSVRRCYQIVNSDEGLHYHNRLKHKLKKEVQCKSCLKPFRSIEQVECHFNQIHAKTEILK